MKIQEIQHKIAESLRNVSDAPELDAQRIILHVLHQHDASYLISHSNEILSDKNLNIICKMAEQRTTSMPLAYILGEADFYGRTFSVTPDVLIPRPDTELLIDKTLQYIQNNFSNKQDIYIADICTGSGCIATTLALEVPHVHIIATDISPIALEIAKQNAAKYNVLDRIEFVQGDLLDPIKNKKIDLLVSNPPYIPNKELSRAEYSVETRGLLFEPEIALNGGSDGLKFVNQIKEYSQTNNIPAIIETVGGEIITIY